MTPLLRLAPLAVGALILVLLLRSFGLDGLADAFARLSPARLLLYFAFTATVILGYSLRWQLVARSLGTRLGLMRFAAARLAGDAVGNLVPSAGLAGDSVRAAIISARGVEGAVATAGVALDRVLETTSNILCALLYVSVFSMTHQGEGSVSAVAIVLVVALAALGVPLVMLRRGQRPLWIIYTLLGERQPPWLAAVRRTEGHLIRVFQEHPSALMLGLLLSFGVEALVLCQYHFLLSAFGIAADLPTLMLVLVGTGMARAVPTPAALGTLEGGQVAVFALAEGAPAIGFVSGMIIRMHETLMMLAGLVALSSNGLSLARLRPFRGSQEVSA